MVTGIKLICMFLFLYTAYAKIVDHERFLNGLKNVHIITGLAVYISWFVPLSEILTFFLLLVPQTLKWGFYAFITLMTIFTGYIISALLLEKKLPCHCGGVIEKLSWTQHLWFNLAFILLAIIAVWLFKSKQNFNNYKR
ncbi:MauE/DoxX family redox-associated membrane protein [Mucilaginibacter lappiensis]